MKRRRRRPCPEPSFVSAASHWPAHPLTSRGVANAPARSGRGPISPCRPSWSAFTALATRKSTAAIHKAVVLTTTARGDITQRTVTLALMRRANSLEACEDRAPVRPCRGQPEWHVRPRAEQDGHPEAGRRVIRFRARNTDARRPRCLISRPGGRVWRWRADGKRLSCPLVT
jgi:hypothetical protein